MPVPVSVTHVQRAGLQASTHTELPTAGPFASLGSRNSEGKANDEDKREIKTMRSESEAHCAKEDDNVPAVRTSHLSFWYCDIGSSVVSSKMDSFDIIVS